MTQHKNIYSALAAAQSAMDPAVKRATNPHFRSKYADLADVVAACQPALNANGIAFFHRPKTVEFGRFMTTVLYHGESDTSIEADVELIVGKNDMQGYKSATTYAKRIGLESVTGLAPEDDDGNDAARAKPPQKAGWSETVIQDLPPDSTPHDKARAVADALIAQFKRKKSAGELSNEWDRRKPDIARIEKFNADMHREVVDAYENRLMDVDPPQMIDGRMAAE